MRSTLSPLCAAAFALLTSACGAEPAPAAPEAAAAPPPAAQGITQTTAQVTPAMVPQAAQIAARRPLGTASLRRLGTVSTPLVTFAAPAVPARPGPGEGVANVTVIHP